MADEHRPSKMQKREHSPRLQEAAFAPSEAANAAPNGQHQQETSTTAANTTTTETHDANQTSEEASSSAQPAAADAPTTNTANPTKMVLDEQGQPLSKSAQKKLRRQQEWEAGREERKVQRREKAKAARTRKREEYAAARAANPDRAGVTNPLPTQRQREKAERAHNQRAKQLPVTFIFDCSFDDLMMDKEMKSLGNQITRCYSDNRNAEFRAHLAISSFGGKLKDRFDGLLNKHYLNWKGFRVFEEDFMEVAEKAKVWMKEPRGGVIAGAMAECAKRREAGRDTVMEGTEEKEQQSAEQPAEQQSTEQQPAEQEGEVIYLSSEGTETLTELKPYSTYIVGGLVDKNRYKGICHKRATERGVKTAKLPIGEFLQMNSRAVLATNHVNEIMVEWLKCGDWGEAFMKVIPKRKGGQLRSTGEEEEVDGEEDEGQGAQGSAETAETAETEAKGNEAAASPPKPVAADA